MSNNYVPIPRGYKGHPDFPDLCYRVQAGRITVVNRQDGTVKHCDLAALATAHYPYDVSEFPDYALIVATDSTIPESPYYPES